MPRWPGGLVGRRSDHLELGCLVELGRLRAGVGYGHGLAGDLESHLELVLGLGRLADGDRELAALTADLAAPPLTDHCGTSPEVLREIEATVHAHRMLDHVVKWGLGSTPARLVADVNTQDEYTHDVVLPWGDELLLVYDCT